MEAVVLHTPHALSIDSLPDPSVGPGEVLVRITNGGICGSDLHYYHHGGFGVVRVKHPMVLGHEIAGTVEEIGDGVAGLTRGTKVAVNPSQPCQDCDFCRQGLFRHCLEMRFMGSAMRDPHVDGGFSQYVVCPAARAVPVGDADLSEAAFAEPLAVCLHAVSQAGPLAGKRVLVAGMGPIGCLTLLAARHAGAGEIVAVDVADATLATAERLGASRVVNVAADPGAMTAYAERKGHFDVVFECSGHPQSLATALTVTRPTGTIVQVGIFADQVTLPLNLAVSKEITLRGTFRFDREFDDAARLIGERSIDVRPLLTEVVPFRDAEAAFQLAGDRSRAMKVQLGFA